MSKSWRTALVVGAIVAVFAATSAGAAKFITGGDIKNGSIGLRDLSRAAKSALKGQTGPAGAAGAAGSGRAAGAPRARRRSARPCAARASPPLASGTRERRGALSRRHGRRRAARVSPGVALHGHAIGRRPTARGWAVDGGRGLPARADAGRRDLHAGQRDGAADRLVSGAWRVRWRLSRRAASRSATAACAAATRAIGTRKGEQET